MQRNKVHAVTTLTKVAQDLEVSEDMLHDLTQQMDTEDGVIWVYGLEEEGVLVLTEDGIECLRDILTDHRRGQA